MTTDLNSRSSPQVHHSYGTRKRQNSILRPSTRARDPSEHSPLTLVVQPRRIKPLGSLAPSVNTPPLLRFRHDKEEKEKEDRELERLRTQLIDFPPKHVVLHPDDANSKVFIAMGRALWSANNRAMTVKDLAEQSTKFGLVCQNTSAAAQAITSFIRNHLHRCEVEQDCPLVLRHVLSGTSRDDSLVPALFSRSGGNVSTVKVKEVTDRNLEQRPGEDENQVVGRKADRSTCFRRGTTVWYLSRAAGAACPFARCGIALRDYVDVESEKQLVEETDDSFSSSLKRKRHREGLRSRNADGTVVTGRGEGRQDDLKEGRKPLKVRLTLRLKPCPTVIRERSESVSSSDSDSSSEDEDDGIRSTFTGSVMSASRPSGSRQEDTPWSLPPYPIQRRISIPPYTPCEESYPSYTWQQSPLSEWTDGSFRRSPSAPLSVASPPPESEGEEEDYHISMTHGVDDDTADWERSTFKTEMQDLDHSESELSSLANVKKEEVGVMEDLLKGMLDVWQKLDVPKGSMDLLSVRPPIDEKSGVKLEDIVPHLSSDVLPLLQQMKLDDDDADALWRPDPSHVGSMSLDLEIKEEEMVESPLQSSRTLHQMLEPAIVPTPRTEFSWKDIELLTPDSVLPQEFEEGEWGHKPTNKVSFNSTFSQSRSSSVVPHESDYVPQSPFTSISACSSPSLSASVRTWGSPEVEREPYTLYSTANTPEMISSAGSDLQSEGVAEVDSVADPVMHPLESPSPLPISATVIHGIPFYLAEASRSLLRRISDDCVCLSSLAAFLDVPCPDFSTPDCMVALPGNSTLQGIWVPLTTARRFVFSCGSDRARSLNVFLSDDLVSTIPLTLRRTLLKRIDYSSSNQVRRPTNQRMPLAQRRKEPSLRPPLVMNDLPVVISGTSWEIGMITNRDVEEQLMAVQSPFTSTFPRIFGEPRKEQPPEEPLSPQEEEMFQSLCQWPDHDGDVPSVKEVVESITPRSPSPVLVASADEESGSDLVMEDANAAPLRRSKRAANAAATQRLRSRLRRPLLTS